MPLIKATIQQQIKALLDEMEQEEGTVEAAQNKFAGRLADVIINAIKSADVITTVNGTPIRAIIT